MKRIIIVFLVAGFFTGCHSGKKKSSKHFSKRSTYSAKVHSAPGTTGTATASSSKVSRINSAEPEETQANQPMSRLDSLLGNTGGNRYYNSDGTNFQGASGAGTGSSYASGAYAAAKAKKAKKKRVYNEDELNPDFIQSANSNTTTLPADTANNPIADTTNTANIGW